MNKTIKLLEKLSNGHGPTGFEGQIRQIIREEITNPEISIDTDGLGSLICKIEKDKQSPKIMLSAHMDELGLMGRYITEEGFIKFQTLGGWLDQSIVNQRWIIMTKSGNIKGITGIKTVHVMTETERKQIFPKDNLFIDVGAKDKKDAEERLGILPGDPISPDSTFETLNSENNVTFLNPKNSSQEYFIETGWASGGNEKIKLPLGDTIWKVKGNSTLTPNNPITIEWDNGDGLIFTKIGYACQHHQSLVHHATK